MVTTVLEAIEVEKSLIQKSIGQFYVRMGLSDTDLSLAASVNTTF